MITLVGIVGGIGSGKSAVAGQFRLLGAEVLDGDRLGHEVLAEPQVIEELRRRWGDRVITQESEPASGSVSINRREVARIVFAGTPQAETELRYLEGVTHPRIRQRIASRVSTIEQRASGGEQPPVVILDAPLLVEAGWDDLCDQIVYVDVPREIRLERLAQRGWDEADLAAREARQLPLAKKRARAYWILDNSGPLKKLPSQIKPIWHGLTLPKTT